MYMADAAPDSGSLPPGRASLPYLTSRRHIDLLRVSSAASRLR
ncbi:putative leader peptide [Streptomyces sp. MP131-18]